MPRDYCGGSGKQYFVQFRGGSFASVTMKTVTWLGWQHTEGVFSSTAYKLYIDDQECGSLEWMESEWPKVRAKKVSLRLERRTDLSSGDDGNLSPAQPGSSVSGSLRSTSIGGQLSDADVNGKTESSHKATSHSGEENHASGRFDSDESFNSEDEQNYGWPGLEKLALNANTASAKKVDDETAIPKKCKLVLVIIIILLAICVALGCYYNYPAVFVPAILLMIGLVVAVLGFNFLNSKTSKTSNASFLSSDVYSTDASFVSNDVYSTNEK